MACTLNNVTTKINEWIERMNGCIMSGSHLTLKNGVKILNYNIFCNTKNLRIHAIIFFFFFFHTDGIQSCFVSLGMPVKFKATYSKD